MARESYFNPALPKWATSDKRELADLLNRLQINKPNQQAVLQSLIAYATKYNTKVVSMEALYQAVQNFAQQNDYKGLKVNVNAIEAIQSVYQVLYKNGFCSVKKNEDGKVNAFVLEEQDLISKEELSEILEKLHSLYQDMETHIPKYFPSTDLLPKVKLSAHTLARVAVSKLSTHKIQELSDGSDLVEILIPNQKSILIAGEMLPKIYNISLTLLNYYLRRPEIGHTSLLLMMKKQFSNFKFKSLPDLIRKDVEDAHYWVSLTTELINISQDRKEILFIQAANLIKYYWIQKNEEEHQIKKRAHLMESILNIVEKNPRPLKRHALLDLYHKSNLFQEYKERDFIQLVGEFLQKFTTSEALDLSPLIFSMEIHEGKEPLYIHRKHLVSLVDQEMGRLGRELRRIFKSHWRDAMLAFEELDEMQEPKAFEKYIENYMAEHAPFYYQLMHNVLLFYNVFQEVAKTMPSIMKRAPIYFNHLNQKGSIPTLKPFSEILGLDREILLKEIKSSLPISYRFPIIRFFLSLFKRLTSRKKRSSFVNSEKSNQTSKVQRSRAKQEQNREQKGQEKAVSGKSLEQNREHYQKIKQELQLYRKKLLRGGDFKALMQEYEKRWNRSLSETAKADNRDLIRGMLHSRLKYMYSPSINQIEQTASDMLATEQVFKKIQDQEAIRMYLILYMTEYLNKKYEKIRS